jgi:phage portal protein BeeE
MLRRSSIANAFPAPVAFLTRQTNTANLQAAESQHMSKAINPRLERRDERLNEQLMPIYDPTRRLFLASEDPSPVDPEMRWQMMQINMRYGVLTINEARDGQGLPPVPWGDKPWLPDTQVQPKVRKRFPGRYSARRKGT